MTSAFQQKSSVSETGPQETNNSCVQKTRSNNMTLPDEVSSKVKYKKKPNKPNSLRNSKTMNK